MGALTEYVRLPSALSRAQTESPPAAAERVVVTTTRAHSRAAVGVEIESDEPELKPYHPILSLIHI